MRPTALAAHFQSNRQETGRRGLAGALSMLRNNYTELLFAND
jgi:hypothetical protein